MFTSIIFGISNNNKTFKNMKNKLLTFAPTEFTNHDFLSICDKINLISDNQFVWVIIKGENINFDWVFNYKKEAKQNIYNFVGKNISNISIQAI
jgi:hypothetical protein